MLKPYKTLNIIIACIFGITITVLSAIFIGRLDIRNTEIRDLTEQLHTTNAELENARTIITDSQSIIAGMREQFESNNGELSDIIQRLYVIKDGLQTLEDCYYNNLQRKQRNNNATDNNNSNTNQE